MPNRLGDACMITILCMQITIHDSTGEADADKA